jgi:hypothetical protein
MNERAQLIKTAIAQELEKSGMSLADLETELAKTAGGPNWLISPKDIVGAVPATASFGAATAGLAGSIGAGGLYGGYLMNEDSNNRILKKIKERKQYLDATRALKEDMANPLTL